MTRSYPITREQLLNYPELEAENMRHKYIEQCADYMSDKIIGCAMNERVAPRFLPTTTCKIQNAIICEDIRWHDVQVDEHGNLSKQPRHELFTEKCLLPSIEIVKERFPDCSFSTDPRKTFILIDWTVRNISKTHHLSDDERLSNMIYSLITGANIDI